ncbi:myb/SANT-like DNA-binding domain-containing protein 4 [Protopterus annectens]|uniref:myb/SANT-like DNA-binding domain-containing protein 4 n=1 Tax=Protopterus annectens TaxID=7888 RepID=UPI001CFA3721|nr:myb/SANT-like DNA-binding domain-containing protein 4 [Protopterus annectens]
MERVVHRGGMVRGGGHRGGMIPRRRGRPRKNPLPVPVAAAAISPPVEVEVELEEEVEELVEGAGTAVAVPTAADMTGVDGASTKRKPNFTTEEDKALVEAYNLRRSAICGRGGNKPAREAAWEEMVEIVNAVGNHNRTMIECRKHLNDLRWRAKEKLLRIQASQKKGGGGPHSALRLTSMEEILVGNYSHTGVQDATGGGFQTSSNTSHYRVGWNQKTSPSQNEGDVQDADTYSSKMEEEEEEEEEEDEEELELRWEWEESDGSWNVYTTELNREMTQAYRLAAF